MTVGNRPKVGFVFSTKDRAEFTRRSLASLDCEGEFDLVWVDGSDSAEGQELPEQARLKHCRLVEVHHGVKGGPDAAIQFGLKRLLALGYDYCGLIENDIVFEPHWLTALLDAMSRARAEGLSVGAATVRSIESRVMLYGPGYVLLWNIGAGMALFTREAAKIILATYQQITSRKIGAFYLSSFDLDLSSIWELWMDRENRQLGCDWAFALNLYQYGLAVVGTVPSQATNIDCDIKVVLRSDYVRGQTSTALAVPRLDRLFHSARHNPLVRFGMLACAILMRKLFRDINGRARWERFLLLIRAYCKRGIRVLYEASLKGRGLL